MKTNPKEHEILRLTFRRRPFEPLLCELRTTCPCGTEYITYVETLGAANEYLNKCGYTWLSGSNGLYIKHV